MIEEYTYRFRLYPDKEQQQFLNIQFGHRRYIYNKLLEISKKEFKNKKIKRNHYKYKKLLPKLKQEYTLLKQANSQNLQETVKNLDKANKNLFKGRAKFPKFKKRKSKQIVQIAQSFEIEKVNERRRLLKIQKLKTKIPIKMNRQLEQIFKGGLNG